MARTKTPSRATRWAEAVASAQGALEEAKTALADAASALEDLKEVQQEYSDWYENMPEGLQQGPTGEKLQEVTNLDLDIDTEGLLDELENALGEAEGMDLPLGWGRD